MRKHRIMGQAGTRSRLFVIAVAGRPFVRGRGGWALNLNRY
jgi:hypothetical protein